MFRLTHPTFAALAFGACAAALAAQVSGGSASSTAPATTSAQAKQDALECRAQAALDAELHELRKTCAVALRAFETCRASRPAWSDVELFSCGFDMSTDLTRGELDEAASLRDCRAPWTARSPATPNADCPVPACEADIERLETELEAKKLEARQASRSAATC